MSSQTSNSSHSVPVSAASGKVFNSIPQTRLRPAFTGHGATPTSPRQSPFSRCRPLHAPSSGPCHLSRAVQGLSHLHRATLGAAPSLSPLLATAKAAFGSPQHFPKILGALMLYSGTVGWRKGGRMFVTTRVEGKVTARERHHLQRKEMLKNW